MTDDVRNSFAQVRTEVGKAVVGQDGAVTGLIIALLVRAATCCWRACPGSPRRCWCARSAAACGWTPSACSSPPT